MSRPKKKTGPKPQPRDPLLLRPPVALAKAARQAAKAEGVAVTEWWYRAARAALGGNK